MKEKNFEFLSGQFERIEMGEEVKKKLLLAFAKDMDTTVIEGKKDLATGVAEIRAVLNKSETNQLQYLNHYKLKYTDNEKQPDINEAIIYVNSKHNFTVDQVVKMMKGGAVESMHQDRNNIEYKGWSTLDVGHTNDAGYPKPKTHHENFGFNLEATYNKMQFDELKEPATRLALFAGLRAGEIMPVHKDGVKYFTTPNIQFKFAKVFHEDMKPLRKSEHMELRHPEFRTESVSKDQEKKQSENKKNSRGKRPG